MNDLVSEYQQYQDATAEGKYSSIFILNFTNHFFSSFFAEEGEGGEEEGEQEGA